MRWQVCQTDNAKSANYCANCGNRFIAGKARRDSWLEWALSQQDFYESYHNHKESTAWVITGFFLPSILTLAFHMASPNILACVLVSLAIFLTTFLALLFIRMQFDRRWWAADTTNSLVNITARLANDELNVPTHLEFKQDRDWGHWPSFIVNEIKSISNPKRDWKEAVEHLISLRLGSLDDRWKTELSSYGLIILAVILAINLEWRRVKGVNSTLREIDAILAITTFISFLFYRIKGQQRTLASKGDMPMNGSSSSAPTEESINAAYQTAVQCFIHEEQLIWVRNGILITFNALVVAAIGLIATFPVWAKIILSLFGCLFSIAWFFSIRRHWEYDSFYVRLCRELESKLGLGNLGPVRRGRLVAEGNEQDVDDEKVKFHPLTLIFRVRFLSDAITWIFFGIYLYLFLRLISVVK